MPPRKKRRSPRKAPPPPPSYEACVVPSGTRVSAASSGGHRANVPSKRQRNKEKGIVPREFIPRIKRFATTPEPLEVTLEVYSGVQNPIWIVNQNDNLYSALLYILQQHVSIDLPSVLGYRGFETHDGEFNRTVAAGSNPELEALLLYSGLNSGHAATIEIVKELLCTEAGEKSYCQPNSGTAMTISTSSPSSTTNPMSWTTTTSSSETPVQTLQTASLDTAPFTTSSSAPLSTNLHSSTQTQTTSPTSTYTSITQTVYDSSTSKQTSTTLTDTSSTSYSPTVPTSTSSSPTLPSTATSSTSFPSPSASSAESTDTNPLHSTSISPSSQTTYTTPSWPRFPSTDTTSTSTQSSTPSSTESTATSSTSFPSSSASSTESSYTNPTHSTSTYPSSHTTSTSPFPSGTPSITPKQCNSPKYEPNKWNNDSNVKKKNNCYNYATNTATGTFAQPGRGSGQVYNALTGAEVQDAAKRDGLKVLKDPGAGKFPNTNGYLVALVMWPGKDFHWYRQDANGNWSHKPGSTAATNKDNNGNVITDPRTANLGPYTFVTFMSYCPGGVTVNK